MASQFPYWGPETGIIAAPNDFVVLVCAGSAGGSVSLNGTWTGDVSIYATDDPASTVQGARIAYKSGIGSSGTTTVEGTGIAFKGSFPVLTGTQSLIVKGASNFSGSVEVTLSATLSSALVGVSGPVHTAEEEAIRNSRGFTFATGLQSVPAGSYFNVAIINTSSNPVTLYFRRRYFFTDRVFADPPILFYQLENPVTTGLTPVAGSNLITGPTSSPSPMSMCTLAFNVSTSHLDTSPPTVPLVSFIGDTDQTFIVDTERQILPGAAVGYFGAGVGNGAGASQIGFLCNWFEEVRP